jgi:rhodanese-related sulfurtransferase
MSSDSESDARKGKEERRKQAASHKKKKVTTEYEDTDDGDDESEDTEERRYRKDAEKRLQETLKRLRQEKRLNQAKDKKEAMVVDIDSDSLSSKEHIPPQVSTHRSNLMVRQNIDDVDSESEGEPSVKPKKQVPKVDTVVVQQDKQNIVSRVASRQNDNESLSDKSAVIRYKKREKEREKNNLLMKKLKNDTDDESDRKPKSKKREEDREKINVMKKLKNDTDDESDRKPKSKPVIEETNHRRSPRINKKKVKMMKDASDSLSENEDDDESVHPESIEDEGNLDDNDEDTLDSENGSNCEFDTDNCRPASIPFFHDGGVWDWSQYVSTVVGEREVKIISKDEFPQKGSIKVMSVRKYMIRRGWDDTNKKQQLIARQKIALTLKTCKHTVKTWLNRFLVDFAPYCNILCRDKVSRRTRAPRNLPELHVAISHYEDIEDVYNVFSLLYFSFDLMKNYAKIISDLVMDENSLQIDPREIAADRRFRREEYQRTGKRQRAKLNCVQKLISITLNEVRKPFRKIIKDKYNIEFTLKRPADKINNKNIRKIRMPAHLYDWMVSGEFVSNIAIVTYFMFVIK